MTTGMYLFLMGVALFFLPKAVVYSIYNYFYKGVKKSFGHFVYDYLFHRHTILLLGSMCLPMIWLLIPVKILQLREVNFIQHSVGGGVAVGLAAIYIIRNTIRIFEETHGKKFLMLHNFFAQFIFVFFVVSGFGVANEILEFWFDLLGVGVFSADRYDTWYDLVANTTGATIVFLLYRLYISAVQLVRHLRE